MPEYVAKIVSVPTGSAEVVHKAVTDEVSVTDEQPEMAAPFDVKLTVPVGAGGPDGVTVAVNVTDPPEVEGFWLEVNVVVEVAVLPVTVTVVPPFDGASLAPSPLKQAITLLAPLPPS